MGDKFSVFVVDDDVFMREVMSGLLMTDFQVETFSSARECMARLAEEKPDLFLLDVNMPEMDGYAFCRQLKDDWETQDIPVAFVSASDTVEARMAGYEAGGEDFICKPVDPAELLNKVMVAQRIHAQKRLLREQAGDAQRTALSVMSSMGELGIVLQFFSRSFLCKDLSAVAEALLEALQQYDLQAAVQLRTAEQILSISKNGTELPLEVSVLNHVRSSGRIFQFKNRCAFNYDHVTILVNNMPLADPDRCGRLRDNLAILAEGADARVLAVEIERENLRRHQAIVEALPRVHHALESMQNNYRRNCFSLTELMVDYQQELTKSFITLGLTEGQESYLSNLATDFMERMVGTQDESLTIVSQLQELATLLEAVIKK